MKKIFLLFVITLLPGCAVESINRNIVHQDPYRMQDKESKSISFSKVTNALQDKQIIGKFYGGLFCILKDALRWNPRGEMIAKLDNVVRKKLEDNGYRLLGKAFSPFNEEFSQQAELLLGGTIKGANSNACYSVQGAKGELALKIEWQIYDTKSKQVVMTLETEGMSKASEFNSSGDGVLVDNAFAMATDNLLADEKFIQLLKKAPATQQKQ